MLETLVVQAHSKCCCEGVCTAGCCMDKAVGRPHYQCHVATLDCFHEGKAVGAALKANEQRAVDIDHLWFGRLRMDRSTAELA